SRCTSDVPSGSWPLTISSRSACATRCSTDSRAIGSNWTPAAICDFISRRYRMATKQNRSRIGVDVGGTFTDLILQASDGRVSIRKVLSTPPAYDRAVVDAVAGLTQGPIEVGGVVHGTTVATNAVLERRGAVTALVTTAGFRDVLELRRLRIPHMYDPFWRKSDPLVP